MTTDFLVDAMVDGMRQRFAYAVKPATELHKPRIAEKFDIERTYWQAEGVVWGIVTGDQLNQQLIANVRWIHNYASIDQLAQPYPGYLDEKAGLVLKELAVTASGRLGQLADGLDAHLSMQPGTALLLLRHLIAQRKILCDMAAPLNEATLVQSLTIAQPIRQRRRAE